MFCYLQCLRLMLLHKICVAEGAVFDEWSICGVSTDSDIASRSRVWLNQLHSCSYVVYSVHLYQWLAVAAAVGLFICLRLCLHTHQSSRHSSVILSRAASSPSHCMPELKVCLTSLICHSSIH